MRRLLAATAAIVLTASLLTPVLADRGGQDGVPGNAPVAPGPSIEPPGHRDRQQHPVADRAQQRDQAGERGMGPYQDRPQDDEKHEARDGWEHPRAESTPKGPALQNGEPDRGGEPKPDNGNRPEAPPGQAISAAVRSRFTNENETTENVHRVRVQLQVDGPEDPDEGDGDDDDDDTDTDDEADGPKNLEQRIWAWQRALQNSARRLPKVNAGAKPFMMVGQPAVADDGTLTITVWKGNRLVRDYLYADDASAITVDPAGEIHLVDASGVTVCDPVEDPGCLESWLAEHPDAYISVWGRVEIDEDGQEVFVAYRITVTDPDMACDDVTPTATPTEAETMPAPTATPTATPTPTAVQTVPQPTIPSPTSTSTPSG